MLIGYFVSYRRILIFDPIFLSGFFSKFPLPVEKTVNFDTFLTFIVTWENIYIKGFAATHYRRFIISFKKWNKKYIPLMPKRIHAHCTPKVTELRIQTAKQNRASKISVLVVLQMTARWRSILLNCERSVWATFASEASYFCKHK